MGFRVLLIAASGKEPCAIQRDYGVVATGAREEFRSPQSSGQHYPMAYLLYINDPDKMASCRLTRYPAMYTEHSKTRFGNGGRSVGAR
jgi:hypothetical protein